MPKPNNRARMKQTGRDTEGLVGELISLLLEKPESNQRLTVLSFKKRSADEPWFLNNDDKEVT